MKSQPFRSFQNRFVDYMISQRRPPAPPPQEFRWLPAHVQPLTTLPGLLTSSALYVTSFLILRSYTRLPTSYPLASIFKAIITWNSRLYALFCLVYIFALLSATLLSKSTALATQDVDEVLRVIYHLTKLYEYIDVPNVLLTASTPTFQPIDLHFFIHHLTTPYLTYVRVLPSDPGSKGWKVFAGLNKGHHALMYAYFGGLWGRTNDWGRRLLQITGIVQLIGGISADLLVLWMRNYLRFDWDEGGIGGENWRNGVSIGILSTYLVLSIRDMRTNNAERRRLEGQKSR